MAGESIYKGGENMNKLVLINGKTVQAELIELSDDFPFYLVEKATYDGNEYAYMEIPVSSVLFYTGEK